MLRDVRDRGCCRADRIQVRAVCGECNGILQSEREPDRIRKTDGRRDHDSRKKGMAWVCGSTI